MRRLPSRARFGRDERGATALEFAIVAPVLFCMVIATIYYGLSLWTQTILDKAAAAGARCAGISSPLCSGPKPGCAGDALACYIVEEASRAGLAALEPGQIEAGRCVENAIPLFRVELRYPFPVLGSTLILTARASFPITGE